MSNPKSAEDPRKLLEEARRAIIGGTSSIRELDLQARVRALCDALNRALEEREDALSYAAEVAQGVTHHSSCLGPSDPTQDPCCRCRAEAAEAKIAALNTEAGHVAFAVSIGWPLPEEVIALRAEVERLKVENSKLDPLDPSFQRYIVFQEENATLRANLARMGEVVEAAKKLRAECKGALGMERDALMELLSLTNVRCLELRIEGFDVARARVEQQGKAPTR